MKTNDVLLIISSLSCHNGRQPAVTGPRYLQPGQDLAARSEEMFGK
jgi:hypothetical protein